MSSIQTIYPQNTHTSAFVGCDGCSQNLPNRVVYEPPIVTTTCPQQSMPMIQPCQDSYMIRNPNVNSVTVADGDGGFYETSPIQAGQFLKSYKIDPLGANRPANLEIDFGAIEASDIDNSSWANLPNGIIPASKINGSTGGNNNGAVTGVSVNGGPVSYPINGIINLSVTTSGGSSSVTPNNITGLTGAGVNKYVGTDSTGVPGVYSLPTATVGGGLNSITPGFGTNVVTSGGTATVSVKATDWVPNSSTTFAQSQLFSIPQASRLMSVDGKSYQPGLTQDEFLWWKNASGVKYGGGVISISSSNPVTSGDFVFAGTYANAILSLPANSVPLSGGNSINSTFTEQSSTQILVYSESVNNFNRTLTWNPAYQTIFQSVNNPNFLYNAAPNYFDSVNIKGEFIVTNVSSSPFTRAEGTPLMFKFELYNGPTATGTPYQTIVRRYNFNAVASNTAAQNGNPGAINLNGQQGAGIQYFPYDFDVASFSQANRDLLNDGLPGKLNITMHVKISAYCGDSQTYGGNGLTLFNRYPTLRGTSNRFNSY
jgi:hypothetical protein